MWNYMVPNTWTVPTIFGCPACQFFNKNNVEMFIPSAHYDCSFVSLTRDEVHPRQTTLTPLAKGKESFRGNTWKVLFVYEMWLSPCRATVAFPYRKIVNSLLLLSINLGQTLRLKNGNVKRKTIRTGTSCYRNDQKDSIIKRTNTTLIFSLVKTRQSRSQIRPTISTSHLPVDTLKDTFHNTPTYFCTTVPRITSHILKVQWTDSDFTWSFDPKTTFMVHFL